MPADTTAVKRKEGRPSREDSVAETEAHTAAGNVMAGRAPSIAQSARGIQREKLTDEEVVNPLQEPEPAQQTTQNVETAQEVVISVDKPAPGAEPSHPPVSPEQTPPCWIPWKPVLFGHPITTRPASRSFAGQGRPIGYARQARSRAQIIVTSHDELTSGYMTDEEGRESQRLMGARIRAIDPRKFEEAETKAAVFPELLWPAALVTMDERDEELLGAAILQPESHRVASSGRMGGRSRIGSGGASSRGTRSSGGSSPKAPSGGRRFGVDIVVPPFGERLRHEFDGRAPLTVSTGECVIRLRAGVWTTRHRLNPFRGRPLAFGHSDLSFASEAAG